MSRHEGMGGEPGRSMTTSARPKGHSRDRSLVSIGAARRLA